MERWEEIACELFVQHRDADGPNATDHISDGASEILEAACRRIADLEQTVVRQGRKLMFYADPENWEGPVSQINLDQGDNARYALLGGELERLLEALGEGE